MALVIKDRVQETTTTTGTGTVTLAGAVLGYSTFSVIGNANTTYYCIFDSGSGAWEAGIGTYTASGTTLSRDTVYANSLGTTALINFGAGSKFVFGGMPANKTVYLDASGNVSALGNVTSGTWSATLGAVSGANLTSLNASNLSSGTIPSAILGNSTVYIGTTAVALNRSSASLSLTGTNIDGNAGTATATAAANLTGTTLASGVVTSSLTTVGNVTTGTWSATLGAVSGANLTSLNASNISSGTVGTARLGSGTADSTTYLRGDSTWATLSSGITITGDSSTATAVYPMFTSATSGTISGANITSTKLTFVPSTGTLSSTVMVATSDERTKTDWEPVQEDFVEALSRVKSGTFRRLDSKQREVGVGAQSLEKILSEAVIEGVDGFKAVNYGGAALVAAIELAREVVALRQELAELKAKIGG